MPRFSVIIPARNEEKHLPKCLESIHAAAGPFDSDVEIVVALNRCTDRTEEIALEHGAKIAHDDSRNLSKIRNAAARLARGEILVTIDADSWMADNMLVEVDRLLRTGKYIGGGVKMWPERWSPGIVASGLLLAAIILWHRVSGGLFWCLRKDFEAIGGFNEELVSLEDLDFAKRLKDHGKSQGKRFKTIAKSYIVTSCRKFDTFGDWFIIRHPRFVYQILRGKNQEAADRLFYDVQR